MIRRHALCLLCIACLAACSTFRWNPGGPAATPKAGGSHSDGSAVEEAAIASVIQKVASVKSDYKILPTDLLSISVYREKDLDREVRVSQNGSITFPLVGSLKVAGQSVTDAEAALSDKLKDYLVNPQVSIFVKEYSNKQVYVLGEVTKPGSYPLPTESRLTVLEAIALAGGFTPIAAKDRTRVVRIVDGKNKTFIIEVSAVTNRGEKQKDIPLEPNDIVYVPQSIF